MELCTNIDIICNNFAIDIRICSYITTRCENNAISLICYRNIIGVLVTVFGIR